MAVPATTPPRSALLQGLLERHRQEAAALRLQLGDPEEALSAFVRDHYDRAALAESLRELLERGAVWDDDDLIDGR